LLIDEFMGWVDALHYSVSTHAEPKYLHAIQATRRQASRLVHRVRAQRDVMQALSRTHHEVLSRKIAPYLRDVYDPCLRVYENLELVRESIGCAGSDRVRPRCGGRRAGHPAASTIGPTGGSPARGPGAGGSRWRRRGRWS